MVENRNIIPDFPRGQAIVNFPLIIGHEYLATHLYRLSICLLPVMCVLCNECQYVMNQDHLPGCTPLNSGNIQLLVKLHWDARRRMKFPQVPDH
jgi:hypothetical protein